MGLSKNILVLDINLLENIMPFLFTCLLTICKCLNRWFLAVNLRLRNYHRSSLGFTFVLLVGHGRVSIVLGSRYSRWPKSLLNVYAFFLSFFFFLSFKWIIIQLKFLTVFYVGIKVPLIWWAIVLLNLIFFQTISVSRFDSLRTLMTIWVLLATKSFLLERFTRKNFNQSFLVSWIHSSMSCFSFFNDLIIIPPIYYNILFLLGRWRNIKWRQNEGEKMTDRGSMKESSYVCMYVCMYRLIDWTWTRELYESDRRYWNFKNWLSSRVRL